MEEKHKARKKESEISKAKMIKKQVSGKAESKELVQKQSNKRLSFFKKAKIDYLPSLDKST